MKPAIDRYHHNVPTSYTLRNQGSQKSDLGKFPRGYGDAITPRLKTDGLRPGMPHPPLLASYWSRVLLFDIRTVHELVQVANMGTRPTPKTDAPQSDPAQFLVMSGQNPNAQPCCFCSSRAEGQGGRDQGTIKLYCAMYLLRLILGKEKRNRSESLLVIK